MVVLAFTLPKAYELKKDEVDKFARQAHHHTKVPTNPVLLPSWLSRRMLRVGKAHFARQPALPALQVASQVQVEYKSDQGNGHVMLHCSDAYQVSAVSLLNSRTALAWIQNQARVSPCMFQEHPFCGICA